MEDDLHVCLGLAVGADGAQGHGLVERRFRFLAQHGARGGEDELVDARFAHGLEQGDGLGDVVLVVLEGVLHGFAHLDEGGEVHDDVDSFGLEDFDDLGGVGEVDLVEGDAVGDGVLVSLDEVIEDDGGMPSDLQLTHAMASDVACTSYDEYVHEYGRWGVAALDRAERGE